MARSKPLRDETRYWIKGAVGKTGALHEQMHIPLSKKIPMHKLEMASHKSGKLGKRAKLAMTLGSFHK